MNARYSDHTRSWFWSGQIPGHYHRRPFLPVLALLLGFAASRCSLAQPVFVPADQLPDQSTCLGNCLTYTVTASGAQPFTYEWRIYTNSSQYRTVAGGTNPTIVLCDLPTNNYRLKVLVTDANGLTNLSPRFAKMTIVDPPTLLQQPVDITRVVGQSVSNSVVAVSAGPLAYQWYFNGQAMAGKTNPLLSFASVQFTDQGAYHVVVTNACGRVVSDTNHLWVTPVGIAVQPTNFARCSLGASVANRVSPSGPSPYFYQWRRNGTALPNQTNAQIALSNLQLTDGGDYTAVISNAGGSITSQVARLEIDPTFIKITGQPIVEDVEPTELGAWCDYDGDGFIDVFVANSFIGQGRLVRNSLYHNEGNGIFTRVTNALTGEAGGTIGSVWADYDNDGRPDLFVTHWGNEPCELFRNLGGGNFTAVSIPYLQTPQSEVDAAWGDWDGDGLVDLLVNTWQSRKDAALRNLGDGVFQPLTTNQVGGLVDDNAISSASCFADFDNDGDADVYISSETGGGLLFRNSGRGMFTKVQLGSLPGPAATVSGIWGDYDNDGWFDLFTGTRFVNLTSTLHKNEGGNSFRDVTIAAGIEPRQGFVWGPAWGDYDNDGDLDLFVPSYVNTNLLYLNQGDGTFRSIQVGSPMLDGANDQAAAWVDYDNDGFLDLFVACGEDLPTANLLYRNNLPATGNTNQWLKVRLNGVVSNRMGIGAKIRVRATIGGRDVWQLRQIAANGGFSSGTEQTAHFGLGDATRVETLRVEWPSGQVTELHDVAARQHLTITEAPGVRVIASAPGTVSMQITAHPGMTVKIEKTDALAGDNWSGNWGLPWKTLLQTNRTMTVTDPDAGQSPHRFYQARAQ